MWALVKDFTHFIYGNDNSNGLNGYGGLYCTHWGWTEEAMKTCVSTQGRLIFKIFLKRYFKRKGNKNETFI